MKKLVRQISQQAKSRVEDQINRFNKGLKISGQPGKISPQAANRMAQFLRSIDKFAKGGQGKGKPMDIDDRAASQVSTAARNFLSQELASEFDLSPLEGQVLDERQINEGAEDRYYEIFEMRHADGEVDPKPKGSGTPDPLVEQAKKFVVEKIEEIKKAAECILKGEWKTYWWGWECGIPTHCAQLIGDLLTKFGFAGSQVVFSAIGKALLDFVATGVWGGITLTLDGLSGVLVLIHLYAFALGHLILEVNNKNGVWIQGNWPWPLPFINVPYVWAVPG